MYTVQGYPGKIGFLSGLSVRGYRASLLTAEDVSCN